MNRGQRHFRGLKLYRTAVLAALGLVVGTCCLCGADDLPDAASATPSLLTQAPWHWGIWLDARYLEEPAPGAEDFFNLSHVYLYSGYFFNPHWQLFGEVEYQRLPDAQGNPESEFELERTYLEYRRSSELRFRLGRFNTRAGIVKPLHWDFTLDTVGDPIMEANSYVPSKSNGLEILGTLVGKKGEWHYSAAFSLSNTTIDDRDPIKEATGGGIDLSYSRPNQFRIGGSFFVYDDPRSEDALASAFLPYLEGYFFSNKVLIRSEYLVLQRQTQPDVETIYGKIKWQFHPKYYLNYRFDKGDDLRYRNLGRHTQQTFTFSFRPENNWRFKLEYAKHRFDRAAGENYEEFAIWTGWAYP